nr:hypothetical protein Iba_chr13dCG11680 [Ipomoea batatas]
MAEPLPAPPSKRGPASKLERSVASGSNLRPQGKATDRDLEKSKKKVNRKLAMESEIDQKKTIENNEKLIEDHVMPERESDRLDSSHLETVAQQVNTDHQTNQIEDMSTSEDQSVSNQNVDPIENRIEVEEEMKPESSVKAQVADMEVKELVDLKPALEMIAAMTDLKARMTSDEFELMSEEILEFTRKIATEQIGDQNKKDILREGMREIAERFVNETKLNQKGNSRESDQDHSVENGESGSSSWQEEFSTVIRELKNNGLKELKGKMKLEGNEETMQTRGVKFAPPMENHEDNAGKNLGTLNSENDLAAERGMPHVCENAPMNRNAHLNTHGEEMTSMKTGVDPATKGVPNVVPPGNQRLGKLGENANVPAWGKNMNTAGGNSGGAASQGWGNRQGVQVERGRNQNKENMNGAQSRNASKNINGDKTPQRMQAPKPQGRGNTGGQQANWNNGNNNTRRNDMGTPGKQAGVIPGNAGTYGRGEGNQNQERRWGYGRGGGRGYNGRGGRGWTGGISHEAVKEYKREGAEICRGENIDPGGEKKDEKREEGVCEMKDEESEEGKLERRKVIEKEIKESLFKAHVSPTRGQPRAQSCWGGSPQL